MGHSLCNSQNQYLVSRAALDIIGEVALGKTLRRSIILTHLSSIVMRRHSELASYSLYLQLSFLSHFCIGLLARQPRRSGMGSGHPRALHANCGEERADFEALKRDRNSCYKAIGVDVIGVTIKMEDTLAASSSTKL
jgi:hypothetical protein